MKRWRQFFVAAVSTYQQGITGRAAAHTFDDGKSAIETVVRARHTRVDGGFGVGRVQCKPDAEQLALIAELVERSELKAHIDTVLPVAEVKQAFTLSEVGRTRGKIVLQVGA